jgi:hypothetical protein
MSHKNRLGRTESLAITPPPVKPQNRPPAVTVVAATVSLFSPGDGNRGAFCGSIFCTFIRRKNREHFRSLSVIIWPDN